MLVRCQVNSRWCRSPGFVKRRGSEKGLAEGLRRCDARLQSSVMVWFWRVAFGLNVSIKNGMSVHDENI